MIGPIYAAPIQTCCDRSTVPIVKPIRIFQFILVTLLFALTCHTVSKDSPYGQTEAAAIWALFATFLLITLVDIVSQCGSDPIPDTPMFLFGVLGTLFFLMAAGDILIASRKNGITGIWRLMLAVILSITCALLFLLDVLLIFLYGY
ncbi:hypothetical protein TSAR_014132 [Trichomalopsis sarcophagae]|uniref:MARVEL domain-containing protein n=1 Tax=Trichomalopsis sarcophagae TaxID=543379 RepID=A0A232F5G2_9HYME|nr:hypothetical protein TSAR_014132 [Trichomalopsis sarcophagae]